MSTTKIALVTGGSRGLGKDMAINLAKKGIDVLLTYNNNEAAAAEVVKTIEAMGQQAAALQLNMSNLKSLDPFIKQVTTTLQSKWKTSAFDFLINNAGFGLGVSFETVTEDFFDEMMNVQFKGIYFLTQKLVPFINKGGRIINISTGLARFTTPGYSVYASMKGAMEILTKYMAKELGAKGISANIVAPGPILTDFNDGIIRNNPHMIEHLSALSPLNRVGEAEDIGPVVAFLCSNDAAWINGQRIEVAGGINL